MISVYTVHWGELSDISVHRSHVSVCSAQQTKHLHNIYTASSTLGRRCINVMQTFCVYSELSYISVNVNSIKSVYIINSVISAYKLNSVISVYM